MYKKNIYFVPLITRSAWISRGVAPSFGFGQAQLVPNPPLFWHVPSGGWASATELGQRLGFRVPARLGTTLPNLAL